MSVTVSWDNPEKTVIRYDLRGAWTWQEFHLAMDEGVVMRTSVSHVVDVIANLEQSAGIPPNTLSQLRRLYKVKLDNRGMVVLAGGSAFVAALVKIFQSLHLRARREAAVAPSVERARALLRERQRGRDKRAGAGWRGS
jgi:hypothetical protein